MTLYYKDGRPSQQAPWMALADDTEAASTLGGKLSLHLFSGAGTGADEARTI